MRKRLPRPAYLEPTDLPAVVEPLLPPIDLPPGKPGAWVRNGRVVAVTDDYAGKAPPLDMIFLPYSSLQVGDAYVAPAPLAPLNIDDVLELIGHFMPGPVEAEPEPAPEPESHFADLMLADETIDDARARLSQRLRELRHYLIAPEIKVNEDGSVGLTAGEQSELQDLERRQTLGRWLEA